MKNVIRNNLWILLVVFFMAMLAVMYKIVDSPQEVNASVDKYEIPAAVIEACEKYGALYGISPEFLEAVDITESTCNPNAVNKTETCFGLGQIHKSSHSDRMAKLGVTNLFDIDQNTHVQADYFSELFEKYEDPALVLMIYHGEMDAEWKYENGKISNYAETILEDAWNLEELHGKHLITHFDLSLNWEDGVG